MKPSLPQWKMSACAFPQTCLAFCLVILVGFEPSGGQAQGIGARGSERLINEPGPSSRAGVPDWSVDEAFTQDIFTFVRIMYSTGGGGWGRGGGGWRVDYPNADLNFSYRLEQLTSMKVHPDGGTIRLTDDQLFD